MEPGGRPAHFGDTLADDRPQLLRTLELLQQQDGPPQLERGMRIRANRASNVVLFRKRPRLVIKFG